MIKKLKYLFVLLLLSLIPISFSYGYYGVQYPYGDNSEKIVYNLGLNSFSGFDVNLYSHGNFYTSGNDDLGGKFVYYVGGPYQYSTYGRSIYFWSNSGLNFGIGLYMGFSNSQYPAYSVIKQGYSQYVCINEGYDSPCWVYTDGYGENDSGIYDVWYNSEGDFSSYFDSNSQFLNPDIFYFSDTLPTYSANAVGCFGYIESNLSLCFVYNYGYGVNEKNLLTSLDAGTFDNSMFLDSLFGSPDSGGGSSNGSTPVSVQCTKGLALRWFEKNGYTSNLCYGGLNDFTINTGLDLDVLPVAGTGLDVEEIRFNTADLYQGGVTGTGMGYNDWYLYWNHMYRLYKYQLYPNNPFLNTPYVLYTYFDFVNMYGDITSRSVIDYCNLKLYTADYSNQYTGSLQSEICTVSNIVGSDLIVGSGDVEMGINIFGNTGSDITNGSDFIKRYWAVLKENFNQVSDNSLGVLPLYIQLALIGILLFRFMSH